MEHFKNPPGGAMAGKPKTELSEKQWKAIRLFEAGSTRKQIAQAIGVSDEYLGSLIAGDIHKAGQISDVFKKEWQRIAEKKDEVSRALVKENTLLAMEQMNRVLKDLTAKKTLTPPEKRLLSIYANALTVAVPKVNIKNLSYSYTQGLTPEELIHEFTRLKSIAESSFNRRRVQEPGQDGSGSLSEGNEPGS